MKKMLAIVALLAVSTPLLGHHGNASTENKMVVLKGTVAHWSGEWNAPSTLVNFGFTARTFKAGAAVTVTLSGVAKSGAPIGRLKSVLLPDGTLMTEDEAVGK